MISELMAHTFAGDVHIGFKRWRARNPPLVRFELRFPLALGLTRDLGWLLTRVVTKDPAASREKWGLNFLDGKWQFVGSPSPAVASFKFNRFGVRFEISRTCQHLIVGAWASSWCLCPVQLDSLVTGIPILDPKLVQVLHERGLRHDQSISTPKEVSDWMFPGSQYLLATGEDLVKRVVALDEDLLFIVRRN